MFEITIKYLRQREWSMGNGQCYECEGVPERWLGHPLHKTTETIGHKKYCSLAACLSELGVKPLIMGDYKTDEKAN